MEAKKSLGQNFLIDKDIIKKIISLFDVSKDDLIIEIGPGRGALTTYLKDKKSQLLCIEIDRDMHKYLDKININVLYSDILKTNLKELLKKYKYNKLYIIGNLPYYITSPIMEYIIRSQVQIEKMIFMVQKEVADRFSASPNTKDYGYMTLYLNHFYNVKSEIFVSKRCFSPVPKVNSEVISLNKRDNIIIVDDGYWKFLKNCFMHKRKTLKNNLSQYDFNIIKPILADNNIKENVRAEELKENIFIKLYNELK